MGSGQHLRAGPKRADRSMSSDKVGVDSSSSCYPYSSVRSRWNRWLVRNVGTGAASQVPSASRVLLCSGASRTHTSLPRWDLNGFQQTGRLKKGPRLRTLLPSAPITSHATRYSPYRLPHEHSCSAVRTTRSTYEAGLSARSSTALIHRHLKDCLFMRSVLSQVITAAAVAM